MPAGTLRFRPSRIHRHRRQKETIKVRKNEENKGVILTAWVSRNRELLTWAIILILNDNNFCSIPRCGTSDLLGSGWLLLRQESGSDVCRCYLTQAQYKSGTLPFTEPTLQMSSGVVSMWCNFGQNQESIGLVGAARQLIQTKMHIFWKAFLTGKKLWTFLFCS